jgi:hypothetical protein
MVGTQPSKLKSSSSLSSHVRGKRLGSSICRTWWLRIDLLSAATQGNDGFLVG